MLVLRMYSSSSSSTPVQLLRSHVTVKSSTTSSIELSWKMNEEMKPTIIAYQVHYQKEASNYIQYGPRLSPTSSEFNILNLVADTYYKVCLVIYRNETSNQVRECVDASTTNWRIPVSISVGSSIGALLALFMIMLVVVAVARCPRFFRLNRKEKIRTRQYDSMSSHYQYDFSDTITNDHDDISDQSDLHPEIGSYRHDYRMAERLCNGSHNQVTLNHLQQNKCISSRPKVHMSRHYHRPSYLMQIAQSSIDSQTEQNDTAQVDPLVDYTVTNKRQIGMNHKQTYCSNTDHELCDFPNKRCHHECNSSGSIVLHNTCDQIEDDDQLYNTEHSTDPVFEGPPLQEISTLNNEKNTEESVDRTDEYEMNEIRCNILDVPCDQSDASRDNCRTDAL